jgi:hypothetical protein
MTIIVLTMTIINGAYVGTTNATPTALSPYVVLPLLLTVLNATPTALSPYVVLPLLLQCYCSVYCLPCVFVVCIRGVDSWCC